MILTKAKAGFLAGCCAMLLAAAPLAARAQTLDQVLGEMDQAAAKFHTAKASFKWDMYQAVVEEHDTQSGTIYFDRGREATRMAAYIKQPAEKTLVYNGKELEFYQPAIKQMTVFTAGKNKSQYESFLTLGFGGSGAELKANWDVTLEGLETMNGVRVAKLDLKPKAQNVKNMFAHVTIWVDPERSISLKQVFYAPSGDIRTAEYANIQYNKPVANSVFSIRTASGTKVEHK